MAIGLFLPADEEGDTTETAAEETTTTEAEASTSTTAATSTSTSATEAKTSTAAEPITSSTTEPTTTTSTTRPTTSTTRRRTTTTEATTTTAYSEACERTVRAAAVVPDTQDTWPDTWPAFEACGTLDALVAAMTDLDPDGRFDTLTDPDNRESTLANLCRTDYWPDGPHDGPICQAI